MQQDHIHKKESELLQSGCIEHAIRTCPRPQCCLCGSDGVKVYDSLTDRAGDVPGTWAIRKCSDLACDLAWIDPMPIPDDIPKLYGRYFTHAPESRPSRLRRICECLSRGVLAWSFGYRDATSVVWRFIGGALVCIPLMRERIGGTIMFLDANSRGRLLDLGCGNGGFLRTMRALGWDVMGVEPDPQAAQLARTNSNIAVFDGTVEKAGFPDESFDTITMHHVIEHLPDPVKTLSECRRILRTGGQLILATPNIASAGLNRYGVDWRSLDAPRHLYIFGPKSIKTVIERAGLEPEWIRTSSRLVPGVWRTSDHLQGKSDNKIFRVLKRPIYQIWAWASMLGDAQCGEEVFASARKNS